MKKASILYLLVLLIGFFVGALRAAELTDSEILKILTTEQPRDKAIRRGLEFLRSMQRGDGAFGDKFPAAASSLAIMAYFAAGHTLEDPQFGPILKRALKAVLARQDDTGYFGRLDGSNMYGHGLATLMLAEALGTTYDPELDDKMRRALEKAVKVTINAALVKKKEGHEGGWRYQPSQEDSDLSLSGWQLMSLHAVQQVGINVPESIIKAAVAYAKRLTTAEGKVGYSRNGEDHPALRGLALLCIAMAGEEKSPQVSAVAGQIVSNPLKWEGEYFFYRAYYDAVGLSRAAPDSWEAYAPNFETMLLARQKENGSWDSPGNELNNAGTVYVTSMAVLAFAVQRYVLPAYQR